MSCLAATIWLPLPLPRRNSIRIQEITMFRGLLLWMAGVPIAGIIILSLLGFLR